jgi:hypothetical protein
MCFVGFVFGKSRMTLDEALSLLLMTERLSLVAPQIVRILVTRQQTEGADLPAPYLGRFLESVSRSSNTIQLCAKECLNQVKPESYGLKREAD